MLKNSNYNNTKKTETNRSKRSTLVHPKLPGGGVLSYKRPLGMCRWMGSHFHDWIDYNWVAFSLELLGWGCKFSDFWGK